MPQGAPPRMSIRAESSEELRSKGRPPSIPRRHHAGQPGRGPEARLREHPEFSERPRARAPRSSMTSSPAIPTLLRMPAAGSSWPRSIWTRATSIDARDYLRRGFDRIDGDHRDERDLRCLPNPRASWRRRSTRGIARSKRGGRPSNSYRRTPRARSGSGNSSRRVGRRSEMPNEPISICTKG